MEIVDEWQRRAWGDCDLSVVDELTAEPFVRHGINGTTTRTRAELKSDLRQYQKALGKPVIEVHDRVAEGDKVWSRTTIRGANLQTGDTRTIERLQIHRVEGGRVAEVWHLVANDVFWDD
mgnify:CR=1 FL=1